MNTSRKTVCLICFIVVLALTIALCAVLCYLNCQNSMEQTVEYALKKAWKGDILFSGAIAIALTVHRFILLSATKSCPNVLE